MSDYLMALNRARELRQRIAGQRDLSEQIKKFIALTQAFLRREYTIHIDYMARNKLLDEMAALERNAEWLKAQAQRAAKSGLRRHEKRSSPTLRGMEGNLRGKAKSMINELVQLIKHLQKLRSNVYLFKSDKKANLITQVGRAGDNWYDHVKGKMTAPPGGDLLVCVAVLVGLISVLTKE